MNETPLSFHQDDVVVFRALEHELFGGTGDEVGDHGIDRDAPALDENSRLASRDEARLMASLDERVPQLQLRGHLADIAVGANREDDESIDFRGATIGDRQIRRRPACIENADVMRARERAELRVVADEGVQAAPNFEPAFDRGTQPPLPLVGKASAGGRNPPKDPPRARDAPLEVAEHRDLAAKTEHILDGLARLLAIGNRDDAIGEVANARVRGLGRQRPKLTIGDDEKMMLWSASHRTGCATRRSTPVRRSMLRSTAG